MSEPMSIPRLDTKIVIVLADTLTAAEAVNAAAVLALSASAAGSDLGAEGVDARGNSYGRIDRHPLPILEADQAALAKLHAGGLEAGTALHVVAFSEVARRARDYESYLAELSRTDPVGNSYVGVLVRGPRNRVTRMTKRLRLFGSADPVSGTARLAGSDSAANPDPASTSDRQGANA